MQKTERNITVVLMISSLLLMLIAFFGTDVHGQQFTTLRVDPPMLEVQVCSEFMVDVVVDTEQLVHQFGVILTYDTSIIDALDAHVYPGFTELYKDVDDTAGRVWIEGIGGPVTGRAKLAYFEFHCTGAGESSLTIYEAYLLDPMGAGIPIDMVHNGFVAQTEWFWKANWTDYAPSGMPDFDQKQNGIQYNWMNPWAPVGNPSFCGPVALANSFWWFDSKFEPNPVPPPTINDGFPLVHSYSDKWDDHDPQNVPWLVEDLAWWIDTDGIRTGIAHCGTEVHEMALGIDSYLNDRGLSDKFYVHLLKAPDIKGIETEVRKSQDVILLLGFWQESEPGYWTRVGGHFVTVAGIDGARAMIAVSDPYLDAAEMGAPGRVIPPGHAHPPINPGTVHNDAMYVSHDAYQALAGSPSPGGAYGLPLYPSYEFFIQYPNFGNCPNEFAQNQGQYVQGVQLYTEIEYAVVVCPWYAKPDYPDYAPSGVPDFDQRQGGTYVWKDSVGAWSHCGPLAVANSLWWLDSEFEPGQISPPMINDGFSLVQSYSPQWDDHDPQNLPPLVEDLAWFMDTNGLRTHLQGRSGTNVYDMEAGIAQYLAKVGVNPPGDVNGDGTVNQTDADIVTAAYGSVPGLFNWNLAADVVPDNIINSKDAALVAGNFGKTGMFHEETVPNPDFFYLEEEFEKCEDVVLLLGFYQEIAPGYFEWFGGHFVTWAGVDSADFMLAVSNPCRDEAEQGGWGQIPVPHQHPPQEPPYTTHNDAMYVSHDLYRVMFNPLAGKWELIGYFDTTFQRAFFDFAVITSPLGVHDVAVTQVSTCKTGCLPKPVVCINNSVCIYVNVENQGNFTETFTVTTYANTTAINATTIMLPSGANLNYTFKWDTTGFSYGNYTITATATPVSGETHLTDNSASCWIIVTCIGDVDGNMKTDIFDIVKVVQRFGTIPGYPKWSPNMDIDNNHKVDIFDIVKTVKGFGSTAP